MTEKQNKAQATGKKVGSVRKKYCEECIDEICNAFSLCMTVKRALIRGDF